VYDESNIVLNVLYTLPPEYANIANMLNTKNIRLTDIDHKHGDE
jgi:hypothetical protein